MVIWEKQAVMIKGCKVICIKPEVSICEYIIFVNPKHLFGTSALLELVLLGLESQYI